MVIKEWHAFCITKETKRLPVSISPPPQRIKAIIHWNEKKNTPKNNQLISNPHIQSEIGCKETIWGPSKKNKF